MANKMCCSCCTGYPSSNLVYLPFKYNIPGHNPPEGSEEDKEVAALVCQTCFDEAHDPLLYPVHEAIINMNLVRVEKPNLTFSPEGHK